MRRCLRRWRSFLLGRAGTGIESPISALFQPHLLVNLVDGISPFTERKYANMNVFRFRCSDSDTGWYVTVVGAIVKVSQCTSPNRWWSLFHVKRVVEVVFGTKPFVQSIGQFPDVEILSHAGR